MSILHKKSIDNQCYMIYSTDYHSVEKKAREYGINHLKLDGTFWYFHIKQNNLSDLVYIENHVFLVASDEEKKIITENSQPLPILAAMCCQHGTAWVIQLTQ